MELKSICLTLIVSLFITKVNAQQGFGTSNPARSSVIDMVAGNKGALLPRVTLTSTVDILTVPSAVNALTVFNTATAGTAPNNVTPGYYYWSVSDNKWIRLMTASDTTVSNASVVNTATVTVNGVTSTGAQIINSNTTSLTGTNLTTTVNGVASTALNLQPAITAGTTHTLSSAVNTITSVVNGVSVTAPAVNSNTLTATNGNLVSTVNGVASTPAVPVLVSASNGLTATNGDVKLGGTLATATTIVTNSPAAATLAITGLQPSATPTTDNVVVADPTTGVLKTIPNAQDWHITGNTGTSATTNFLGTTNNVPLAFRVNNQRVGYFTTDGASVLSNNIFFGVGSGTVNGGPANIGIGKNTLNVNSIGFENVAIGLNALVANTSSNDNVAIGTYALEDLTSGGLDNIGIGYKAGNGLATGTMNIMIGNQAGGVNPAGDYQLNIGNGIYGTGFSSNNPTVPAGLVGIRIPAPTELLDLGGTANLGDGGLRIRNINSVNYTGALTTPPAGGVAVATDRVVVADATGVLKTVPAASVAVEPWFVQSTTTPATADAQAIFHTGKVAIGKNTMFGTPANEMLAVNGSIRTVGSLYADYVFEDYFKGESKIKADYKFKTLKEVEDYIKQNNHLPGVTSIKDLIKTPEGYSFNLTELSVQSLEKLEELYLHVIEQQKQIEAKDKEIKELKDQAAITNKRLEKLEEALIK